MSGGGAAAARGEAHRDRLGCGTFLYIGATEISSDEFEMTARACDEMHGPAPPGWRVVRKPGHAHTHHSHEPPSRSSRTCAFSAYALGRVRDPHEQLRAARGLGARGKASRVGAAFTRAAER